MKLLLCNVPKHDAKRLAHLVVNDYGAACVNLVGPVVSIYRWKDELCEDEEMTLFIKVASAKVSALTDALVEAHPYELPEVLSLEVDEGSSYRPYLHWVESI